MLNSQLNNFGNGMNSFNNGSNGMMMGNNQQSSVFGTQNSMGLLGNNNSTLNFVESNEPDFEAPRISSVVPVTIGQMRKSIHSDLNKLYSIDQQLIKRVFFVGVVRHIEISKSSIKYHFEDGTGRMFGNFMEQFKELEKTFKPELQQNEQNTEMNFEEQNQQRNEQWLQNLNTTYLNQYVAVMGSVKQYNNNPSLLILDLDLITDHNEITYHFLNTIRFHLYNTKGKGRNYILQRQEKEKQYLQEKELQQQQQPQQQQQQFYPQNQQQQQQQQQFVSQNQQQNNSYLMNNQPQQQQQQQQFYPQNQQQTSLQQNQFLQQNQQVNNQFLQQPINNQQQQYSNPYLQQSHF